MMGSSVLGAGFVVLSGFLGGPMGGSLLAKPFGLVFLVVFGLGTILMALVREDERIEKEASEILREQEVLNAVMIAVSQGLRLETILDRAVEKVVEIFGVTAAEIHLLDEETKTLFLKSQRGLSPEFIGTGTLQQGEGLAGRVAGTGQPLFLVSLAEDGSVDRKWVKKGGFASYGGVPLLSKGRFLGVLGFYTRNSRTFSAEEQRLLAAVGHRIGVAVQNGLVYEEAALRARRFIAISQAITVTRQLGTLDEVLRDITKVLVQSLGFEQSWIGLVDEEGKMLRGRAGFGEGMTVEAVASCYSILPDSKNPAVEAVVHQRPAVYQFVEDVADGDLRVWLDERKVQSLGYVPILSGDRAVGVIGVFHVTDQAFEEEDVKTLVSVAEQAAIAIENAQLYEQIKTSEERYRTLFEAAGTSLVILDVDLRLRLVNHAFEELSGYRRDELIGRMTLSEFLDRGDSWKEKMVEEKEEPPQSWEAQFVDRKGVRKQVHVTTTRIPGSSDTLVSLIDMTRERELERRLFRSEELAAIGELSAGIAHEIRNPLVAITTSVSLLKDEPDLSQEGRQLLDVVKEESDHLAAIVDDFLKFARPKKPAFQEEDINKLLKDVVGRYKDWNDKKVKWVEAYGEDVPEISLDRHQMQQVITNLVLNGLDAMEERGELRVGTQVEAMRGEAWVRVTISDSGVGIPEEEIAKIFQPFYSTKERGTGMGLAICRRIVDDHDGEILVESKVRKGTTFSVLLPVNRNRDASH